MWGEEIIKNQLRENENESIGNNKKEATFISLTGITIEIFDGLVKRLTPFYEASESKRLFKSKEKENKAGQPKDLDLENQLLML